MKIKFKNFWLDWRTTILGLIAGVLVVLGDAISSVEGLTFKGILGGIIVAIGGGLTDLKSQESKLFKEKTKTQEDES